MIDVERARSQTPGCEERIHLNNAGAALMSRGVLDVQIEHLRLESRLGGYEAARATESSFEETYDLVAALIGASRDEIAQVENATAGWNLAFGSIPLEGGDTILTAEAEYASNFISYLKVARDRGVEVRVVQSDGTGQIDVEALAAAIDGTTRLISITHVPTNGGLVNPAEEVGVIAREHGIPFLLDACQSVGQLDIDVDRLGCDFLTATGRKFLRGPRGTGFLYVRRSALEAFEPPVIDLHGATWVEARGYELRPDARRYENWEFNHAAVHGLRQAVSEALALGTAEIEKVVVRLGERLRTELRAAGLETFDIGERQSAIVTTSVPGVPAAEVRDRLHARGVNVSVTGPASTRIDAERRGLPDLVRLSPHYYNTDDELTATVEMLQGL